MSGLRQRFLRLPLWGQYTVVLVPAVLVIALMASADDNGSDEVVTRTVTSTTPASSAEAAAGTATATQTQTQTVPAQTAADARQAVDDDDYPAAILIAAGLTAREATVIGRRIPNRLGTRALAALRVGDRRSARRFIIEAKEYPSTARVRDAHAQYKAAKARSAQRRQQRVAAARQRRADAAQRDREAAEAQAEPEPGSQGGGCDPGYSGCVPHHPPDVNCPEVAGPVQVTGDDPHGLDRDGDGVACE